MKINRIPSIIFLQILIVGSVFAQITREGTAAANFLLIEPGSRAVGMGSAHVAVGGDSYAAYYNPAGLAQISSYKIDLQRTKWIADIAYDYLSAAFPVHRSMVAGFQLISLSMADMEVRTELAQDGTGYLTDLETSGNLLRCRRCLLPARHGRSRCNIVVAVIQRQIGKFPSHGAILQCNHLVRDSCSHQRFRSKNAACSPRAVNDNGGILCQ